MRYVSPARRPGRPETTLGRVRRTMLTEEARRVREEKPFDPEAPREHYASAHHFAVNPREDPVMVGILDGMARTFYVWAWADAMENAGHSLQGELMEQAPETPEEAVEVAAKAVLAIEKANHATLPELYEKMSTMDGDHTREPTPFDFGYDLAMMYMGSGVSWFDDHPGDESDLDVPHGEGMYVFLDDEEDDEDMERNARQTPPASGWCRICGDSAPRGESLCGRHAARFSDPASRLDAAHTLNPGPRGEADEQAATELALYIDNESDLSLLGPSGRGKAIRENQLKRIRNGSFDFEKSVKLFEYLAEDGAKRYAKEFDEARNWSRMFNVPTRHLAAVEMAKRFVEQYEAGDFD